MFKVRFLNEGCHAVLGVQVSEAVIGFKVSVGVKWLKVGLKRVNGSLSTEVFNML